MSLQSIHNILCGRLTRAVYWKNVEQLICVFCDDNDTLKNNICALQPFRFSVASCRQIHGLDPYIRHVIGLDPYIRHLIGLDPYIRHVIGLDHYIRHVIGLDPYIRHVIGLDPYIGHVMV